MPEKEYKLSPVGQVQSGSDGFVFKIGLKYRDALQEWNDFGNIADECWRAIPEHFPFVELGAHVIMPNHVHGIIQITDVGRGAAMLRPYNDNVKPGSLGTIVRSYKSAVSYRIHKEHNTTRTK